MALILPEFLFPKRPQRQMPFFRHILPLTLLF